MIFSCYRNGEDDMMGFCTVLSVGFMPVLAVTSLVLNSFTLVVLFMFKLPSSQHRPIEGFVIAHILCAICVLAGLNIGYPAVILHTAFFSLAAYLLFTMLVGGWCQLTMPLEFPTIRLALVQYSWLGFCAVWTIVPVLSSFPSSKYDSLTGTWAMETKEFGIIFFWYLHRVFPEVLVIFFVIWLHIESRNKIDDKRITLTIQVIGITFLVANVPSIVNCLHRDFDRSDVFHTVQVVMEISSTIPTFFVLYFLNPDFSGAVKSIILERNLFSRERRRSSGAKELPHAATPFTKKRNTVKREEAIEMEGMMVQEDTQDKS